MMTIKSIEDLPDEAGWAHDDERRTKYLQRVSEVFPSRKTIVPAAVAAAAIPVLAGLLTDFIAGEIEKEASKYEAQFIASRFEQAYWAERTETEAIPAWVGFELIRSTTRSREHPGGDPAFRLVAALVPSDDPHFFLVKPLFLQVSRTKAKLARSSPVVAMDVTIALDASWNDEKGITRAQRIAAVTWTVGGYDLDGAPQYFLDSDAASSDALVAGWFAAPPMTHILSGGKWTLAERGTPIKLTVGVTERDESRARAHLERVAKLVRENRETIVQQVGDLTKP